jgi:hypothetical protein
MRNRLSPAGQVEPHATVLLDRHIEANDQIAAALAHGSILAV